MGNLTVFLILALLVPYFAWGIYAMHQRFLRHHEWPLFIEAATLTLLLVYYAFAFPLLRGFLSDTPAAMLFAMLGLFASGAALYGHMAISLTAKLVVDAVTHGGPPIESPRLGPAEALERVRDFEGACNEYLVLARMYPNDLVVKVRMANNLIELGRKEEAAEWFERALQRGDSRQLHSNAASRLAELAERELGDPDRARRAIDLYLTKYPSASDREEMETRKQSIGQYKKKERSLDLESMDTVKVRVEPDTVRIPRSTTKKTSSRPLPGIEAISAPLTQEPAKADDEDDGEAPRGGPTGDSFTLEAMQEAPALELSANEDEVRSSESSTSLGLDRMEDAPKEKP